MQRLVNGQAWHEAQHAAHRYTAAVELQVEALYKVYSNRSLAYAKANRFAEALHDAEKVVGLCPDWSKGHWRLGMAHVGMKQNLLAVASFARCWQLDKGNLPSLVHALSCVDFPSIEHAGEATICFAEVQASVLHHKCPVQY